MPETTLIAGTDTSGKLTRADLALGPAPHSTSTHQVIPHIDIVHALEEQLGFRHIAIASEEYAPPLPHRGRSGTRENHRNRADPSGTRVARRIAARSDGGAGRPGEQLAPRTQ